MKRLLIMSAVAGLIASVVQAQAPQEGQPAGSGIKVEKIVAAVSVEKREPVGETSSFPAGTARVYIWTRITAQTAPVRIKHVYYHEDKKAAEVELAVNSSPYRVWSNKAVRPGSWKVEVTDETGVVLSSLTFSVASPDEAPVKP
jgi:hypothetical protein